MKREIIFHSCGLILEYKFVFLIIVRIILNEQREKIFSYDTNSVKRLEKISTSRQI